MFGPGPILILSTALFLLYGFFVSVEKVKNKRLILAKTRDQVDNLLERSTAFFASKINYLGKYTIQLSWYYSVHRFLRAFLAVLVRIYDAIEVFFINNKKKAKTLKSEKKKIQRAQGHLGLVAEHKVLTTLTSSEKKDLLQKKLDGE